MCKIQPISHFKLTATGNYDFGYGKGMVGFLSTAANLRRPQLGLIELESKLRHQLPI
jgi:hypothetical protein